MKNYMKLLSLLLVLLWGVACTDRSNPEIEEVATFEGQQITGIAVSGTGRIFVNCPRWRPGVKYSVMEVSENNQSEPYPSEVWNSWALNEPVTDSVFVAVQSVVAYNDDLYVLDTRNPLFQGVVGSPLLFVFDLNKNSLKHIYKLDSAAYHPDSYVNDLRVDSKNGKIYFTDSGNSGLIVLDMESGRSRRVLDNHPSTEAETDSLVIDGKIWKNSVHADGIALDTGQNKLYYHALTGYTLYALPVGLLDFATEDSVIADGVELVAKTAAPDGMIMDGRGNLYFADLENHKIQYLTAEREIKTLAFGDKIKWADSFAIYGGYLYYTNSRIHEAGNDVSELTFSVNRLPLSD